MRRRLEVTLGAMAFAAALAACSSPTPTPTPTATPEPTPMPVPTATPTPEPGPAPSGPSLSDGTASNPNDGTDTSTPPSPEERAAFIAGFAEVRGVDEEAAACVADGLTAIGVPLNVERFLTAVVTEGPIAVVLAECGVPAAMPLGSG